MEIKVDTPSKKENLKEWFINRAHKKAIVWWLALFSFIESIFFPIPTDIFLIGVLAVRKAKGWLKFSLVTSIASILGGVVGYFIGAKLFETIGSHLFEIYNLADEMAVVSELFNKNAFVAMFLSAFTPIPFKVFTISAGFFDISFFTFLIASIIGRTLRFGIVGYLMKVFRHTIAHLVYKYFNLIGIATAFIVATYIIVKAV
jgi:membrane protein YqaA with SNARE-associated domain